MLGLSVGLTMPPMRRASANATARVRRLPARAREGLAKSPAGSAFTSATMPGGDGPWGAGKRQRPDTEITRRDVAKCFGDDLCGEQDLVALVEQLFPIQNQPAEFFSGQSLAREIEQHMVRNPRDWDVEYLFQKIGALTCSRDRFVRLLEAALYPLGRRGPEQTSAAHAAIAAVFSHSTPETKAAFFLYGRIGAQPENLQQCTDG